MHGTEVSSHSDVGLPVLFLHALIASHNGIQMASWEHVIILVQK